ncbi:MAG: hypothetical protein Q6352_011160 [Candidatus Freyrarchaeum guaymaensis]|nr:hypothetical protein [Candidatus Sigynarchaeota archaeon]
MKTKLVVFDADDTLWNVSKRYASLLKPPLKPTGTDTLRDSEGSTVRLLPGVRKVLKELKERGILISSSKPEQPRTQHGAGVSQAIPTRSLLYSPSS